jgi:hypothetical protein
MEKRRINYLAGVIADESLLLLENLKHAKFLSLKHGTNTGCSHGNACVGGTVIVT